MADQDKNMVGNAVDPRENDNEDMENGDEDLDEVEEINEEGKRFENNVFGPCRPSVY